MVPSQNQNKVKHVLQAPSLCKGIGASLLVCRHPGQKLSLSSAPLSASQIPTGRSLCCSQCPKGVRSAQELKISRYITES